MVIHTIGISIIYSLKTFIMRNFVRSIFTAGLMLMSITILQAQYDVPTNYATVVEALNAITAATEVTEVTINVAEGEILEPVQWTGKPGRPVKITIQGAGAGKTILKGYDDIDVPLPGEDKGHRLLNLYSTTDDGLDLTLRDMTLKNFGFGNTNGGGTINITTAGATVQVSLINVNFENCICRRGAAVQIYYDCKTLIVDNCSFFNCTSFVRGWNGGVILINGANATIKNSTFMSNVNNVMDTRDATDNDYKRGGAITMESDKGNVVATLENNAFVNNITLSDSVNKIHPTISFNSVNEALSFTVTMKDNIAIGNRVSGHDNDVDLYYDAGIEYLTSPLILTSEGNIMNSGLKQVIEIVGSDILYFDVPAETEGVIFNSEFTYTHSAIDFTMDGPLPAVLVDEAGVKYVEYSGDGVTTAIKPAVSSDNRINIYSYDRNLVVDGLLRGEVLEVYTITGSLFIRQKATESNVSLTMPKGLYIVRAGSMARKVFVP